MSPPRSPAGAGVPFSPEMRAWVCDECGRLLGAHDDAWVKRLRRRLTHHFGEAPDEARLKVQVGHYGEVSDFAYSILAQFIAQSKTGFAWTGDVDYTALEAAVAARFPGEAPEFIRCLVGWAVVWGYLR